MQGLALVDAMVMRNACENPVAHAMAHTSVFAIGESAIARIVTRGVNPEAVGICACLVHLRRPYAGESRRTYSKVLVSWTRFQLAGLSSRFR